MKHALIWTFLWPILLWVRYLEYTHNKELRIWRQGFDAGREAP